MSKKLTPNTYRSLVVKITHELTDLETFVRNRTALGYWNIGRYIHEHLLANEKRAEYGAALYERLAKDVERDKTSLMRATQFYRAYPILAERRQLTWNHYKSLITVKDKVERKKLESKVISNDWDAKKLQEYVSAKHKLTGTDSTKTIPQLSFTRGRLHTYQIVKANEPFAKTTPFVLDLGFRLQHIPPSNARVKEGEVVALTFENGEVTGLQKTEATKNELFTYEAHIEKVVDGDTLLASFYFQGRFLIAQKLRLRGIDAPEMDTDEGKKAKRFVESRLKDCDFVIVKTYKDRTDKFDRYLADVFYAVGEKDSAQAAIQGLFLNQELLDNRLAVEYK